MELISGIETSISRQSTTWVAPKNHEEASFLSQIHIKKDLLSILVQSIFTWNNYYNSKGVRMKDIESKSSVCSLNFALQCKIQATNYVFSSDMLSISIRFGIQVFDICSAFIFFFWCAIHRFKLDENRINILCEHWVCILVVHAKRNA